MNPRPNPSLKPTRYGRRRGPLGSNARSPIQNVAVELLDQGVDAVAAVLVENIRGGHGTPKTSCLRSK